MNLEIYDNGMKQYYYIAGYKSYEKADINIASELSLSLREYHKILLSHSAYECDDGQNCNFKNKEDAEKALIALDPYIIMHKLVGEV